MSLRADRGFTLMEVLVAFLIAATVIGGAMGVLSSSMRLSGKADEELRIWSELEQVIQRLYADPRNLMNLDRIEIGEDTYVTLEKRVVDEDETGELSPRGMHLMRVMLRSQGREIEISVLMPEDFVLEDGAEVEVATFRSQAQMASQYDGWQGDSQFLHQWEESMLSYDVLSTGREPSGLSSFSIGGGEKNVAAQPVAVSPGGWADEGYEDDGAEEDAGQEPEGVATPKGDQWVKKVISEDEYYYVNKENGSMLHVWKDKEYARWKTEWEY